jgi:calcineurin-like phosphoesterase family protein
MIYVIGNDLAVRDKMSEVFKLVRERLTGSEKIVVGNNGSSTVKVCVHLFPEDGWRPVLYSGEFDLGLSAEEIADRVVMEYTFL